MKFIAISNNGSQETELSYDTFTFSGGEEHIRFSNDADKAIEAIKITAKLVNSANILKLMLAVDALKRKYGPKLSLELTCPYFPYARQDRVCVEGEAHGAHVMATLINALAFDKVTIWDAHSDVSPALLNNVTNLQQGPIIEQHTQLAERLRDKQFTLVSPDAGATKKTQNVAKHFGGGIEVLQAEKIRDLATGQITHTDIHGDVTGKDLLIVDDICDGGRTFIELAKVLRQKQCASISLYVTHGIFSKGIEVFNGLIDNIYTTDSFNTFTAKIQPEDNTNLHIVNV